MSAMNRSSFVYVTFIRTTPLKLWEALTDPQFTRQYWFGTAVESGWTKGSPWKLIGSGGDLTDSERSSRSIRRGAWSSAGRTSGNPSSRRRGPGAAPWSSSRWDAR